MDDNVKVGYVYVYGYEYYVDNTHKKMCHGIVTTTRPVATPERI